MISAVSLVVNEQTLVANVAEFALYVGRYENEHHCSSAAILARASILFSLPIYLNDKFKLLRFCGKNGTVLCSLRMKEAGIYKMLNERIYFGRSGLKWNYV